MKFYIYLWGYIFVPFIQINLNYWSLLFAGLLPCWSFKSIMSGKADFLPARILVISFNKIFDIVYLSNFQEWMELSYFLWFFFSCICFILYCNLLLGINPVTTGYSEEQLDFQMPTLLKNHGHIAASLVTFAILGYGSAVGCSLNIR